MQRLLFILLIIAFVVTCSKSNEPIADDGSLVSGAEEYAVLSAVIDSLHGQPWFFDYFDMIVISRESNELAHISNDTAFVAEMVRGIDSTASEDLIADFCQMNLKAYSWKDSFHVRIPYGWTKDTSFYRLFRIQGELSLSRVGFNIKHTRALVEAEFDCGMLCGEYSLVFLERQESHWIVTKRTIYMAS